METHLKRFFIEVYNDPSMYEEYLNGRVFINRDLYSKWFHALEKRNELFASTIKQYNRVGRKDIIVESQLSDDYSVGSYFNNDVISNVSEFGKFKIEKKQLGDDNNHYICNGYFIDTLEQIYKVLENGTFTVGICTEKKTDLFKDVVAHYNMLRDFLLKNGYNTSCIQTNVGSNNRVYLLMYERKISKRNK